MEESVNVAKVCGFILLMTANINLVPLLRVSASWPVYPYGLFVKPVKVGNKRCFNWSKQH